MKTYPPCRAARGAALLAALLAPAPVLAQGAQAPPDPSGAVRFGHASATDAYRSDDEPGAGAASPGPAAPPPAPADAAPGAGGAADAPPDPATAPVPEPVREPRDPGASERGPASGPAAPDAAARLGLGYESAFDAYERYEESDGPDWRGANDRVGEIGGWRTYAREPYEGESATDGEID